MYKLTLIPIFGLLLLSLSGCEHASNQDIGTVGGAAGGAVIGSAVSGGRTVPTIGGAVVGGVIGNQIGETIDEDEMNLY